MEWLKANVAIYHDFMEPSSLSGSQIAESTGRKKKTAEPVSSGDRGLFSF